MSSFFGDVKNKETGEIKRCCFFDDYFGRHQYGMKIEGIQCVLDEDSFNQDWERV